MSEVRVELGFSGGGRATVEATQSQWDSLRDACTTGAGGWVTIGTKDDESFIVDAASVVFASVSGVSRGIGFGT